MRRLRRAGLELVHGDPPRADAGLLPSLWPLPGRAVAHLSASPIHQETAMLLMAKSMAEQQATGCHHTSSGDPEAYREQSAPRLIFSLY